jgi:NitT/TauT family transport system substrate-binding protein
MKKRYVLAALAAAAVAAAAVIGVLSISAGAAPKKQALTKVTLQLKWVTQAQFAGYYAARDKGYYEQAGLDVTIRPGGPSIIPEQVVAGGRAQFGLDWLPSLLTARDKGQPLINIAQVFTRSGLTLITWKDTGINTVGKMRNKTVANWLGGNEYEVFAALVKNGMDPVHNKGVKIFRQPFTMDFFIKRQVAAASAMTYNELAQVLESKNPKTGKLFTLKDLNVIPMQKLGTGMLEDGVFTREDWIKNKANQATAKKFLAASFKGWVYCRTHLADCVQMVLKSGSALGKGHQKWMLNEINALIWPSPLGIGVMNAKDFKRTALTTYKYAKPKLHGVPSKVAYRTDLAKAADAILKAQHVDIYGRSWHKLKVNVTPGGK